MTAHSFLGLVLLFAMSSPVPAAAQARTSRVSLFSGASHLYAIDGDRAIHHRTSEGAWETLPPPTGCRPYSLGRPTTGFVDAEGRLWVLGPTCVLVWSGTAWESERVALLTHGHLRALAALPGDAWVTLLEDDNDDARHRWTAVLRSPTGTRIAPLGEQQAYERLEIIALGGSRDDLTLVTALRRGTASGVERTHHFDGRRWRERNGLRDEPWGGMALPDGRLLVLGSRRAYAGAAGRWEPLFDLPANTFFSHAAGTLDELWLASARRAARRTPSGLTDVGLSVRSPTPFAGAVYADAEGRLVEVRGQTLVPVQPSRTRDAFPPPALTTVLRGELALAEPADPPAIMGTWLERDGAIYALAATAADDPALRCPGEHTWSLLRVEGGRAVARRTLGPITCGDSQPLASPSLRLADIDHDGQLELVARVPLQLVGSSLGIRPTLAARVLALVVVAPSDLRVEGAVVVEAERYEIERFQRLFGAFVPSGDGARAARPAAAHAHGRSARAPRLPECTRDASTDTWTCPGPSLESALFRGMRDLRPLALPAPSPR